jgi:eukaryotic-like serine/threonine-protein kinase
MPIDPNFLTPGGALQSPLLGRALGRMGEDASGPALGAQVGPYRIESELGRGGMAVVYLARRTDGEFEQSVALKLVRPEGNSEFAQALLRQERQILAGLQHPGIARLLDGGHSDDGQLWFALELVHGTRIDRYCHERRLPVAARLQLFLQVCAAMQFAHGRLLVHRDIKPSNILVTHDASVKLLDFGIAQVLDSSSGATLNTYALTPGFASPEQLRGDPVTTASDIYQLGRLLQCLLQPAPAATDVKTATDAPATTILQPLDAAHAVAAPLIEPPPDLAAIIRKAMQGEPAARYSTVAELSGDIENFLAHRPIVARQGGAWYRGACFLRRHRLASLAAFATIVAFAAMATIFTLRLANERDQARMAAAQARQEAARANQVRDFLVGMFKVADPNVNRGDKLTASQILERGATDIDKALAGQGPLQANLLVVIGEVYSSLGDYPRAEPLLARAVLLQRQNAMAPPAEVAHALRQYAYAEHKLDKFELARDLLDQAQGLLGDRPEAKSELAAVLDQRGLAQKHLNDLEGALSSHRAAQAAARAAFDDARIAVVDNHLGLLLYNLDRYAEAQAVYEEGLEFARRRFGERDTRTSSIEENLAAVLSVQGNFDKALQLMLSAAATERELIGEDNGDFPETLNVLGNIYADAGRNSEAVATYDRALAIDRRTGRGESEGAASRLSNLGSAYAELKRYDEARTSFEQAVAIRSRLNGPDHMEVAHTQTMLATLDLEQQQPQRAERVARQVLEKLNGKLPPAHRYIADAEIALGRALMAQNRGAEARPLIESALAKVAGDDATVKQLTQMLADLPQAQTGKR